MFGRKEPSRKPESGALTAWKPSREMTDVRDFMSRAFEDFFGNGREWPMDFFGVKSWAPAVDVEEKDKEYVFAVELPGLKKDDFKVEMQDGTLTISGERLEKKEDKGSNYIRHEQHYGLFRRAFTMPPDASAEGIKAAYKGGILTITVPRSEKAKPKAVPVEVD